MKSFGHELNEVSLVYHRDRLIDLPIIKNSFDASELLRSRFPKGIINLKEVFYVRYLSNGNHVLAISKLSEGGLTGTVIDLRHLFAQALLLNASAVILCHNHPSGNLKSSPKDVEISLKAIEAGKVLDVQVLDHIILTFESYLSLADEGLLSIS